MAGQVHACLGAAGLAVLVELDARFGNVEGQQIVLLTSLAQRIGAGLQAVHGRVAGVTQLLGLLVGQEAAHVDHGFEEPVRDDLALAVDHHAARHGQAVVVVQQRAQVGGKLLGQHRDGAPGQVVGEAAVERFLVQPGVVLHVLAHVGDVHVQLPALAAGQGLHAHGVVVVAGVLGVDGVHLVLAAVLAAFQVGFGGLGELLDAVEDGRGKRPRQFLVLLEHHLDLFPGGTFLGLFPVFALTGKRFGAGDGRRLGRASARSGGGGHDGVAVSELEAVAGDEAFHAVHQLAH